jgi:hypothetical protein
MCAIKIGGSPFKTLAEAEETCKAMLGHLTSLDQECLKVLAARTSGAGEHRVADSAPKHHQQISATLAPRGPSVQDGGIAPPRRSGAHAFSLGGAGEE